VAINFLRVNGKKYSIVVYFSRVVITITTSRKLVKMGRRICLLVYYAELVDAKLWMAMEGVALKGGLEPWIMEDMIKRGF